MPVNKDYPVLNGRVGEKQPSQLSDSSMDNAVPHRTPTGLCQPVELTGKFISKSSRQRITKILLTVKLGDFIYHKLIKNCYSDRHTLEGQVDRRN